MAMSFDTSPVSQMQKPLQIIPYNGPPKPKQSSQRYPLKKVPSSEDVRYDIDEILGIRPRLSSEPKNRGDLAPTSYRVEVVDLTYLDGEVNSEIGGGRGGGSGDINSNNGFSTQNERESVEFKQSISMRISPEGTRDGSSNRPASSKGSSQENAVVIEDSQPESDTDKSCLREGDIGTQIDDQLAVSGVSTLERCSRECPRGLEDDINSEAVSRAGTQASGLPRRELASTPPTSSSMMNIEQQAQKVSGHTILKATTHQPQRPMQEKAEQGNFPKLENMSNSSGIDNDDDSDNHTMWLTRKRKRSPPAEQHSRTSNTASKQCPRYATRSTRQRKPSTSRGRPLSNRPSASKPPAAQCSSYDMKICYSDDSSEENGDRGCHLRGNKRLKSTPRPHRSSSVDEEDEYEVEQILDAHVYRNRLQYRAKWLGYEDDPQWYNASNFKNSPYKLRDFHRANPTRPGPPKRLEAWVQCWKEDRDADDHPDDNKPERSQTGGGTP